MKTHFTRKNFIVLSCVFFYLVITAFCALCLDAKSSIVRDGNPIQLIAKAFGFTLVSINLATGVLCAMLGIYTLLFAAALIYETRLAKYYGEKANSLKWWGIYVITFVVCYGLAIGIGVIAHIPVDATALGYSFSFCLQAFLIGLIIFIFAAALVLFALLLILNIKNYGTPYKWFGPKVEKAELDEKLQERIEENKQIEQGLLAAAFGDVKAQGVARTTESNTNSSTSANSSLENNYNLVKERVFPGLCKIDTIHEIVLQEDFANDINLATLCEQFRNYLASRERLYYDMPTIRAFVAGLSASRLIILEGLSGTGKSSIARYFSDFINEKSFFVPVQATWRDRTSVLGFFNDFSKTYNETEFLKHLYEATYRARHVNIMVLDEMNISRIEYYFADFLSIMEYPMNDWVLKIMQLPYDFEAPLHLEDGELHIPETTWFIGTANKDDSTYTITDKVYDRAIVISFSDRNEPFQVVGKSDPITLSYDYLMDLYHQAQNDEDNRLNGADIAKFKTITDQIYDSFDLTFGNRIMNQIELFVPTFVACGGTKEEALDFMLARKVLIKLDGRFEEYVKKGLEELLKLIKKTYGKGNFALSQELIERLLKRF